ncbi:hypothetical protein [Umezakia ovalisporum]|jgi:hypothetical protein|uniref:Uncharacterized protein n=2 Tax=Umezakia ovalisporum TaxID=75695 RepID=A0AA43GWP2_9CYAN|nr:hypothetical protein [Umezakia ovalisporum]MBI1242643.1 hypothetical protein [Nostoc sp. RI_552]MDH6058668.1 hypothetical protein [Umezakia ovalisporum FSS-43]MDH6063109.1 hypothetical protein [Umezakia ovalisporum FSS-62]MDH6071607.1 hypothetical protein [Umezakia ovalisporum CobakiLakeA]MDH6073031.1 hypothetical protein [Umezakia ovalisporum CS-1034]
MANCPNCGSTHIQLNKETQVNWGRAVAGWVLFGIVGGAIGAVTGEAKNANVCMDCGTSWKAEDIYKILEVIKKLANIKLDLSEEKHRSFLNKFITTIGTYIEEVSETEKKAEAFVTKAKQEAESKYVFASGCGCLFLIFSIFTALSAADISGFAFILGLLVFIIGCLIDASRSNANKENIKKEIEMAKAKAEEMNINAQEKLKAKVSLFVQNNPLN